MEKEMTEYYSSLEERMILAKKFTIILSISLFLVVLALYSLAFYSYDVIFHLAWIFGVYHDQLMITFSQAFLFLISCFTSILLMVYLRKYISSKSKMKHFLDALQISS